MNIFSNISKATVKDFTKHFLGPDTVLILRLISMDSSEFLAHEILISLWKIYLDIYEIDRENTSEDFSESKSSRKKAENRYNLEEIIEQPFLMQHFKVTEV
jgi:hypothetical protein